MRLAELTGRYSELWRHFHILDHPLALYGLYLAHRHTLADPQVVGWSILYHDAIYDPRSAPGRNEELSAQLAQQRLNPLLGPVRTARVAHNTRATAGHAAENMDYDLAFFLDCDLSILGSKPPVYQQYARAIRQEYAHVPPARYIAGRIAVLQSLAQGAEDSGIYRTEVLKAEFENQAQENIAQEIAELRRS